MEQHASSSRRVLAKIENTSESSAMQPVKLESTKASTGAIPRKKRKFSIKARRSDVNNENRVITARYLQLHDVTDQACNGGESRYSDVEGDHAVYACHECDYTGFYKTWTYHIKAGACISRGTYYALRADLPLLFPVPDIFFRVYNLKDTIFRPFFLMQFCAPLISFPLNLTSMQKYRKCSYRNDKKVVKRR